MWIIAKRRPPLEHWFPVALIVHHSTAKTVAWNLAKMEPDSSFILSPCFETYLAWHEEIRPDGTSQFTGEIQYGGTSHLCRHGISGKDQCLVCRQEGKYG